MNSISVNVIKKTENWNDIEWFIDEIRLADHLVDKKIEELPRNVEPFDDLCPAWTQKLEYSGDTRFIWHLIGLNNAIVPLYMCPDDLDFSCIVLVVEVEKTDDFVYWKRVGYADIKNYDFQEEKRCGILCIEAYTDDDWEKYGDNIALAELDSEEWYEWVSANWEEELYRRRMNYTYAKYLQEGNIFWFANLNFQFNKNEYDEMIENYKKLDESLE